VFRAKVELFLVLPKFDWKKIIQKFQKKMVQEGSPLYNRRLIFDHLLAVNPCGLQAKKEDFQKTTVKSRSNQIWISLFEALDLAHCSNPIHLCSLAARNIQKFDFPEL
jgi:hypothetical protein